jgi:hypothetical protein
VRCQIAVYEQEIPHLEETPQHPSNWRVIQSSLLGPFMHSRGPLKGPLQCAGPFGPRPSGAESHVSPRYMCQPVKSVRIRTGSENHTWHIHGIAGHAVCGRLRCGDDDLVMYMPVPSIFECRTVTHAIVEPGCDFHQTRSNHVSTNYLKSDASRLVLLQPGQILHACDRAACCSCSCTTAR